MSELFFWWTGVVFWICAGGFSVIGGLPSGETLKGCVRLTFYEFGLVVWRLLPGNMEVFARLESLQYNFMHVAGDWYIGLSIPRWVSRRLRKLVQ